MGLWEHWLKNKQLKEQDDIATDPDKTFKFNNDTSEYGTDHDGVKHELFDLVWRKYTDETMQFLHGIGQRGDEEVAALLRKLEDDVAPTQMREPRHPSDGDEMVPPEADTGNSEMGGEE